MLSPSNIRDAVRDVLLSSAGRVSAYEILDRLPTSLRDQILSERGMPGAGSGNSYSAASLVTDAAEMILPSLDPPYRVYHDVRGMTFTVAGQSILPGNEVIAYYQLAFPPATGGTLWGDPGVAQTGSTREPQSNPDASNLRASRYPAPRVAGGSGMPWYNKSGWLWFWLIAFWPVALYGLHKSTRISNRTKNLIGAGVLALIGVSAVASGWETQSEGTDSRFVSTQAAREASAPQISPKEQVRRALNRSERLTADRRYEEALEDLRGVKALAPEQVLPRMARIKQQGASSLTGEAKKIREKNPELALELLERAAAFGGNEAVRLAPRVRRDIARRAERAAKTKAAIVRYIRTATAKTGAMGEGIERFNELLTTMRANPLLLRDTEWRLQVAIRLAAIKMACDEAREVRAPAECRAAHEKLVTMARETERYADLMARGIDTLDTSTIDAAGQHIQQAGAMGQPFLNELISLKDRYDIE
jgi:hypothetical protein